MDVRYVRLGRNASKDEFQSVVRNAGGDRKFQAAELLTLIIAIEASGIANERKRLDQTRDGIIRRVRNSSRSLTARDETTAGGVFVYAGGVKRAGRRSIWAAIDVAADGRTLTLLKIVDTYAGSDDEERGLLADALERKERGERVS